MEPILFDALDGDYGTFSNFARAPIVVGGAIWPTSEHYFQAMKFAGAPDVEQIRAARSAAIAKRMGRSRQRPLRSDWDAVRDGVMRAAVTAKFRQHPPLRRLLLSTGDRPIVERSKRDKYWGDGGDGNGLNRLGQILVEVRAELRRAGAEADATRIAAVRASLEPGRTWLLFAHGTVVVGAGTSPNACLLLASEGPVHPGSSAGDFGVIAIEGGGWMITSHHPDLITHVAPGEIAAGASDLAIGLHGRKNRDLDAHELTVVHLEGAAPF